MDQATLHQWLQAVEALLQRMEENIAVQGRMIAMLDRGGHDVEAAMMSLRRLEAKRANHVADRDRLIRYLANAFSATSTWSDIACRQSRIAAWPGMKCRASNVATMEGNFGVFRQWAAIGTTREGYYVHMFVWEAQNTFSYLSAEETTADFAKWMFEHGKSAAQFSPVARYQDAERASSRF